MLLSEENKSSPKKLVIITGVSGAGLTTTLHAFEDIGFEAISNLPVNLIQSVINDTKTSKPLAIGIDARTRGFAIPTLVGLVEELRAGENWDVSLLFIEADEKTLIRRYSETRRKHPMAQDEGPNIGVKREVDFLSDIKNLADQVIDTSEFAPQQLRNEIELWYLDADSGKLAITVQSFSYKRGLPRGLDMVIDCRFLKNPYWDVELRPKTGKDPRVADYIASDETYEPFFKQLTNLLDILLPAYKKEGKSYFSLGLGCTGGYHRSVYVADQVAQYLTDRGWIISTRHREFET